MGKQLIHGGKQAQQSLPARLELRDLSAHGLKLSQEHRSAFFQAAEER